MASPAAASKEAMFVAVCLVLLLHSSVGHQPPKSRPPPPPHCHYTGHQPPPPPAPTPTPTPMPTPTLSPPSPTMLPLVPAPTPMLPPPVPSPTLTPMMPTPTPTPTLPPVPPPSPTPTPPVPGPTPTPTLPPVPPSSPAPSPVQPPSPTLSPPVPPPSSPPPVNCSYIYCASQCTPICQASHDAGVAKCYSDYVAGFNGCYGSCTSHVCPGDSCVNSGCGFAHCPCDNANATSCCQSCGNALSTEYQRCLNSYDRGVGYCVMSCQDTCYKNKCTQPQQGA